MLRYFFQLLLLLLPVCVFAGELRVKSVTLTTDPMPVSMRRADLNGEVCGLVKVIIPGRRVAFEGNIVGDTEYKTSEYWCYLSPGTRFLKVKYPDVGPLMIDFNEYFSGGIAGARIYEMVLQVPATSSQAIAGSPLKGSIHIEGLTQNVRSGEAEEKARVIDGLMLYHNYHDGAYQQAIDLTGDPFGGSTLQNNNTVDYLISGVNPGDSLTFIFKDNRYAPQTVRIPDEDLLKGSFNFKLKKRRCDVRLQVRDFDTDAPVDSVYVTMQNENYVWGRSNKTFMGYTDSDGVLLLKNLVVDKKVAIYLLKDGYQYRGGYEIYPQRESDKVIRLSPEYMYMTVKGAAGVVVTTGDGREFHPDADGNVRVSRPRTHEILTITAPECITYRLELHGYPDRKRVLKMKKGNPHDVSEWITWKGKYERKSGR